LLKINIINFKYIVVNANKQKLIIKSCRSLKIMLKIKLKNNIRIKQVVKIERSLVIVVYFVLEILIIVQDEILSSCFAIEKLNKIKKFTNKDYLFKSILLDAYSYVANREMSFVYICNNCLVSLCIS